VDVEEFHSTGATLMTVINTNIQSQVAQNALKVNGRAMSNAMNQLATGNRINSAKDDAAGLAISENMSAQVRSLNMAVRNANDGISLAQTAEGAMVEISNMLQRMRELAVQSASGTLSDTQREYLNTEFGELNNQIISTVSNTKWNGMAVLTNASAGNTFTIQSGADANQTIVVTSKQITVAPTADISRASAASTAITSMDTAIGLVNTARASLGASINRLTSAADNVSNTAVNLAESRSRVRDADYGAATAELARTMIIQQAGTAVLAQANQAPQTVLALLR
jgi:flagellin